LLPEPFWCKTKLEDMLKHRFVLLLLMIVIAVVAMACANMPGQKEAVPSLPETATPSPEDTRTPAPTATPVYGGKKSSVELIKAAYERGEINYDEQTLYLVYSVFEPELLPPEYQSDVPHKDATPIILETKRNWDRLSPDTCDKISPYIQPLQR
jgi:hypothetical protein